VIYIKWDSLARSFDLFSNLWKPDWDRMGSLLKIGWPISITVTFEGMLFNAGVLIAGAVGVIEQAGFQIALKILASVLAIGIFALPVALAPGWVASFYFNMDAADTKPVFEYVVIFLPLAAGFMFFDAVQVIPFTSAQHRHLFRIAKQLHALSVHPLGEKYYFYSALKP